MELLEKERLVRTSDVDHADWNYRPGLSYVMRRRFALVLDLLPRYSRRLLEVGTGSGVFLPELSRHCGELYGIDVHERIPEVATSIEASGLRASLSRQSATQLDFDDGFFDSIVAVSALEFIDDVTPAVAELARVLKPEGRLIAVMPKKSPLLDLALYLATGESAERDYADRRERVLPALAQRFRIVRAKSFAPIYTAYEFALTPAAASGRGPSDGRAYSIQSPL